MAEEKVGFFKRLVSGLSKTRDSIVAGIDSIFSGYSSIDDDFYDEIEEILVMGDIGISTTTKIIEDLKERVAREKIKDPAERRLSLKARCTQNGYFSYELVNSKVNAVRKKKDAFLTDKEDVRSHGLGIASVREVVRKYDGMMDISYTEDEFRVVILIGAR